jgi:hypothetical protein
LSSACAIVTPASVKEKSIANALMVFMIDFHTIETTCHIAAAQLTTHHPIKRFQNGVVQ